MKVHGVELDKSALQGKSLFIATPMFKGECAGIYAASLLKLGCALQEWGIPFEFAYRDGDALVTRARNALCVEFLNSTRTHMLCWDADIAQEAGDVLVMLALDKAVVAAPYPTKRINWEKIANVVSKVAHATAKDLSRLGSSDFAVDYPAKEFNPDAPLSVPHAAGGSMLVARHVFEDFIRRYGVEKIGGRPRDDESSYLGHTWEFFACDRDEDGYIQPEDYSFCRRWRNLGGEIWLCPWMTLTHRGPMNFSGSMKYAFLEGGRFNLKRAEREEREKEPVSK